MKVFVVTEPELGWDCLKGVYTDENYVYSKFSNRDRYQIFEKTVDETKLPKLEGKDLAKYGRTDYVYTPIVGEIKCKGMMIAEIKGETVYNIIDGYEGDFVINFDGVEQGLTLDAVSVIADLFCAHTGIDQSTMRIYTDGYMSYFLGTTVEYEDSREIWDSFKAKGVELYY